MAADASKAAVQPEFTVLRKPGDGDAAAMDFWYTAVHQGAPVTFRVLDDDGIDPVDGAAYMQARVQAMQRHVQEACIDAAAALAYRAVLVEVSLLDDQRAIPDEAQRDMDCAVDLWPPLHVALMTASKSAAQSLLQFHVEHAVTAMTCIANTPSTVMDAAATGSSNRAAAAAGAAAAAAADGLASPSTPAETRERLPSAAPPTPILECQVRRELGGAVVLLGHFDGRVRLSASVAVRRSRPPSPVRGGSAATSAALPSSLDGTGAWGADDALVQSLCAHNNALLKEEETLFEDLGESYGLCNIITAMRPLLQSVVFELQRRPRGSCGTGGSGRNTSSAPPSPPPQRRPHHHHDPQPRAARECAVPAVPETAIDLVHDYCSSLSMQPQHPPLLVDGDTLFRLCNHGDVALLMTVMDVFEGCLAPILRGQTLLTDRGSNPAAGRPESAAAPGAGAGPAPSISSGGISANFASSAPSTHLTSIPAPLAPQSSASFLTSAVPALGSGFIAVGRDASVHSAAGTPRGSSLGRHAHAHAPAAPPPAPFWWSCPPQQVHHLAFAAVWIGCREVAEESSGSGRRRRAVSISNENRLMLATVRQLQESRVAAQKLDSTIWSGHLVTITKLLSKECSLEDYMDFVEEGGYFAFTSPRGFSGLFLSVLVSGAMAAALVREPATLRVLRRKVETLLVDVPGRPSPLRTYVLGRPSTHAERFHELWLDAGCRSGDAGGGGSARGGEQPPLKFRSRIELLYYAVVEQVVAAAEVAWAEHGAQHGQSTPAAPAAAETEASAPLAATAPPPPPPSTWPSGATQSEAQTGLQAWLFLWANFFTGLRERPGHRRSLSYSSTSSQMMAQSQERQAAPHPPSNASTDTAPLSFGSLSPQGASAGVAAAAVAASSRDPHSTSADDLIGEDASDAAELVQRVCHSLVDRLEAGQEPLPALRRVLFPNGTNDVDSGVSGSATPAHVDKALPVSFIDQEFATAQRAFAATANKESNEVKLKFYGLFKQATVGDVNTSRPGIFDYAGRAKWDAWSKLKGMSLLDAKRMYVSEYKMMVELRKVQKP